MTLLFYAAFVFSAAVWQVVLNCTRPHCAGRWRVAALSLQVAVILFSAFKLFSRGGTESPRDLGAGAAWGMMDEAVLLLFLGVLGILGFFFMDFVSETIAWYARRRRATNKQ